MGFTCTEWKLNRRWIYNSEDGNPVGETNFVISDKTLRQILRAHPRFEKYDNVAEFLGCYEPESDGEYVYLIAQAQNEIIKDCGVAYYDGYAADEVKITLLTQEQAEKLPAEMLKRDCWWWLRSPHSSNDATGVDYDGWTYNFNVNYTSVGVVPAFTINNLKAKFGDKVHVGRLSCTVVGENLVLSDTMVCRHRYDEKSSDWETSELKAFIESEDFLNKYVKF